jgi:hypothetical protein
VEHEIRDIDDVIDRAQADGFEGGESLMVTPEMRMAV